jgi:hypothetical protein
MEWITETFVMVIIVIVLLTLGPFLARFLGCSLLLARMKRKSEKVRKLRSELLGLGQVRGHWERLDGELGSLDDSGRHAWLERMRTEGGVVKQRN